MVIETLPRKKTNTLLTPEIAVKENRRLKNVEEYSILDSMPEREYNEITKLASYICNTPMSQLNIVHSKTQFTKSSYGIEGVYTPREQTVCNQAIKTPNEVCIVPDLRDDPRFYDLPAVTGETALVFYAGVPLVSPDGYALGTLCVLDTKPCELNDVQIDTLKALANQVISLLELRRNKLLLEKAKTELEEKNAELEKFAYVVAHDIKSPLSSITGIAKCLTKRYASELTPEVAEMMQMITCSSERLKAIVDGILEHSRSENQVIENSQEINVGTFLQETADLFSYYQDCRFIIPTANATIRANRTVLSQVLINLVANAIKYNDKKEVEITLEFAETPCSYSISVKDNGPGIATKNHDEIFGIFKVCAEKDRYGNKGTGIGLATVKKLVAKLKGSIELVSECGKGSTFTAAFPK